MGEILGDDWGVLIRGRDRPVVWKQIDAGLVATFVKRDLKSVRQHPLLHVAPPAAAGTDAY